MLKLSRLIAITFLFSNCISSKKEIVLKPHIEQYLSIYLEDNKKLNPKDNVVIIWYDTFSENKFQLNIISDMTDNVQYSFKAEGDSIYFGYYKEFKVFVIDKQHKLIMDNYESIILVDDFNSDVIPTSYNGPFWNLKIKEGKLINFSSQYCEPSTNVLERLESVTIPLCSCAIY